MSIFWPESDRTSAQQTFRTTLYGLCKVLGDDLVSENGLKIQQPIATLESEYILCHNCGQWG